MRFIPVLRPFFPISGLIVLNAVIVYALSKDAKGCSKAYINGLVMMGLTLLSVTMASVAPGQGMVMFWNMLLLASRCALCPCWFWMALDMNGYKPAGLEPKVAYFIAMTPVFIFSTIIFTNPLHGWYWTKTWFEGRTLVIEHGALSALNTVYSQALLVASSLIYLIGVIRHRGNERLRLIVLAIAYGFLFVGDWTWRLELPILGGVNPLSFFYTIGFYAVGASVLLCGFPRVRPPITEADIKAMPPLELPAPDADHEESIAAARQDRSPPAPFPAPNELSERQLDILRKVMGGEPYKAIAAELGITERTVKYHMGQILDKCGLETREQLIAWAAMQGIGSVAKAPRS